MALIGEIPIYYPGSSDWQVYTERLEQFFEINNMVPEKKKALLITSMGEDVYKTLRDVCHPTAPKDKTYEELIQLLNKQFCVKTSVYRERFKFYNARQYSNESIAQWFARIKKLSVDCKFGDQFEKFVLDRLITGLQPGPVLDRLCEEDGKMTLQQAIDIAINKESAAGLAIQLPSAGGNIASPLDQGNAEPYRPKRQYKRKRACDMDFPSNI